MARPKILLSTYVLRLQDKKHNNLFLSRFDEDKDFMNYYRKYLIHFGRRLFLKGKGGLKKSLEFGKIIRVNKESRFLYGYFETGLAGFEQPIRDLDTFLDVFTVEKKHARIIRTFFLLFVPKDRTFGYLILQRQSNFGIKELVESSLNSYLKLEIEKKVKLSLNDFMVNKIIQRMIENGKIKEFEMVKNTIPRTYEDLYDKGVGYVPGKYKVHLTTEYSLPMKGQAMNLLYKGVSDKGSIEIAGLDDDFDEVSFLLEENGHKKKLVIKNRVQAVPDYDVTDSLKYLGDSPTLSSLTEQALNLIRDMMESQDPTLVKDYGF